MHDAPEPASPQAGPAPAAGELVMLRLYVAGHTPKSVTALSNLKRLCDEHLPGRYSIEVIDLLVAPGRAQADQIVAIPTLVRTLPAPVRKLIGTLADTEKVLVGLEIKPG